jgi:hypothetical protein
MPGAYYENIDFLVKSIRVESTAGSGATTIHGNQNGSVVRIKGVSPALAGFTIENGSGYPAGPYGVTAGGGILFDDTAQALVENCVIRNNYAMKGDGVAAVSARGVVANCTIENNGGQWYPGWCWSEDDGGGAWGTQDLWFDNCTIRNNQATVHGGGVYGCSLTSCVVQDNISAEGAGLSQCYAWSTTIEHNLAHSCDDSYTWAGGAENCTLEYCHLINNEAWDEAGGARQSTLRNCWISGNAITAPYPWSYPWGGGAEDCTLEDCWFQDNWIYDSGGNPAQGGGSFGGSALRCVFVNNTAAVGAGTCYTSLDGCVVYGNQGVGVELTDVMTCSIVRANVAGQVHNLGTVMWSDVQGGAAGVGNIDVDPLFWDPAARDFHLMQGSPCIDTGDPTHTDPDGSRMDMGAFPYRASECLPPIVYCPAGQSADPVCTPSISISGIARVGAASGCTIAAGHVPGQRMGLVFYGLSGASQVPWGTSYSCVTPPRQRTPAQSSGGTAGLCNGLVGVDFNSWLHANGDPLTLGTVVWAQVWYRDPAAVKSTNFSNAVRFMMCQ